MSVDERLHEAARAVNPKIVFPEGDDSRILRAAAILARSRTARPILIGPALRIGQAAAAIDRDLPGLVQVVDPLTYDGAPALADALGLARASIGMSRDEAIAALNDPLTFGAMLLRVGAADGCVVGARYASAAVLRVALQLVGLRPGSGLVSSLFLMILTGGRAVTFADCAVVPDPDSNQLAEIAVASARAHQQLTGDPPLVAMLSFSTKGSVADHPSVRKVREATRLARDLAPTVPIDGELQFDAAYVRAIAETKAPGSPVGGRANVFIFPNLDAGNIGYKIVERLAGARAIGPLLQGLSKPMHDLSRGCHEDDVVAVAHVCALQMRAQQS